MTAQIPEKIIIEGMQQPLLSNPLEQFFSLGGNDPKFQSTSTALWRGYVGTWELLNDRLYLVALSGTLLDGRIACLNTVFPGYPDRVFAHWYSGRLRIPQGKMIEYRHMGYASTFETDQFITIFDGVVTETITRENGIAPPDAKAGYSIKAMTRWEASNEQSQGTK